MAPPAVTYRYSARLPHDAKAAFAWLTDYRDDDASLTTTMVRERRVLSRAADTVEMDATIDPLGRRYSGRATVRLFPGELRYTAQVGKRIANEYVLTPTPEGCRFDVAYRVTPKRWTDWVRLTLARRRFEKQADAMWRGFFDAMAKDLAS